MKYRVKVKVSWSSIDKNSGAPIQGKKWYVLQQKFWFFWIDMHDYETIEEAQIDCDQFNRVG